MSKDKEEDEDGISFAEFQTLCKEAGIQADSNARMEEDFRLGQAFADVTDEIIIAVEAHPAMNSAHEGFAILKEEVDELWDEVKRKEEERDIKHMRKEASQVAAMAIRFMAEICHDEKGQN